MERITIKNFDNLSINTVATALQLIDWKSIAKFNHYKSTFNGIDVYYRKTKSGIAIDIHKI